MTSHPAPYTASILERAAPYLDGLTVLDVDPDRAGGVVTSWEDVRLVDVDPVDPGQPGEVVELDPVEEARQAVSSTANDGAALLRSDALRLPLRDESVDLIVTSPPYFALRSYQDDGDHYAGQIGSEPHWRDFIDALLAVTAECARVLKPSGSIFVNLGDKYSGAGGPGGDYNKGGLKDGQPRYGASDYWSKMAPAKTGIPAKSLMLLPERYRIGCVDQLGLIARAVIIWSKPNGLPESVTDRVRRSHEDWVHLVKRPRYYAAVDEIREPSVTGDRVMFQSTRGQSPGLPPRGPSDLASVVRANNPLGKLPGSVWEVATEPLRVPDWVGVDHFAAFPLEWPRRLILGWSPSGVCTVCGEGRRPVVEKTTLGFDNNPRKGMGGGDKDRWAAMKAASPDRITGEACGCPTPDAPTRPAVVLDPFGGTGTTAMVARSLGRFGVSVDLSADYLRLARWRIWQSGHGQKAVSRTWRERQTSLFDEGAA